MSSNQAVYIVASLRTPIGSHHGSLSSLSAVDLGSHVIRAAISRVPRLKNDDVDEVFFGNVLSAGLGQNVARQCALGAGLPVSTVCTTVNKVCASSMKAITLAAQTIQLGMADVVIAGGTESMSNVPNYISARPCEDEKPTDGTTNGIITDGLRDAFGQKEHMGLKGELCARTHGISRTDQDQYTLNSYAKARVAADKGSFLREIAPVKIATVGQRPSFVKKDECPLKFDESKLRRLSPVFASEAAGGTVTAANSPALADGASAVILVSERKLLALNLTPLSRILGYADAETHPGAFTTAPALALPKALERAGLALQDVDAFEINEAFAVAALANVRNLGIDASLVNLHGGAVALGHPLAASGSRIVSTLHGVLREGHGTRRIGAAVICNGGGGATALVVENLQT